MSKRCRFDGLRCYRSSCDVFDFATGEVSVCGRHRNPLGRLGGILR
jgi:hypothetical protein